MTFLTWNNQADADASLAAVNASYGCKYTASNGYVMEVWDSVTKSDAEEKWGFAKPEARLQKTIEELEATLVAGYTELSERPSNWIPEEEV